VTNLPHCSSNVAIRHNDATRRCDGDMTLRRDFALSRHNRQCCLQMPISPFTISILCDAQSTLYSCIISINYAKIHSPKTKTPFVMNFFISFSFFYIKIDQEMLVVKFINPITHLCRKHHCTQHSLTRNLKKLWNSSYKTIQEMGRSTLIL
jgi:hypothetical protein